MKEHYCDKIISLIEVICEKYQVRYMTDENGEFIREKHKTQYRKVKCTPTEQDIITLQSLNKMVESHKLFIDYFRFSFDKYGKNIKFESAELAFNLSNDYQLCKQKVLAVVQQNVTEQMALRITEDKGAVAKVDK